MRPADSAERPPSVAERLSQALLHVAADDARAARRLLPIQPRQAAFFTQQAAEKQVLALIHAEGRGPVARSHQHQIAVLVDYLPTDHPLYADLQGLDRTTQFATRLRYPSASGHLPDPPDAGYLGQLLDEIDALHDEVRERCHDIARGRPG